MRQCVCCNRHSNHILTGTAAAVLYRVLASGKASQATPFAYVRDLLVSHQDIRRRQLRRRFLGPG
jgi:hypothetical protein